MIEGAVPDRLEDPVFAGPVVQATRTTVLLRLPNVGRFLVEARGRVRVEREAGACDADVRCFLDGPVTAARALLRGVIPLDAAAVAVDGGAVVISGRSGVGKSALAAALALRGHSVLADSVALVEPAESPAGVPAVSVRGPEVVLWPDVVAALGLDYASGRIVRPGLTKRAFRLGPEPAPAPLHTVVLLGTDTLVAEPQVRSLSGHEKTVPLGRSSWFGQLVAPMGLEPVRFRTLAAMGNVAQVLRLGRPHTGAGANALAALVEEALG